MDRDLLFDMSSALYLKQKGSYIKKDQKLLCGADEEDGDGEREGDVLSILDDDEDLDVPIPTSVPMEKATEGIRDSMGEQTDEEVQTDESPRASTSKGKSGGKGKGSPGSVKKKKDRAGVEDVEDVEDVEEIGTTGQKVGKVGKGTSRPPGMRRDDSASTLCEASSSPDGEEGVEGGEGEKEGKGEEVEVEIKVRFAGDMYDIISTGTDDLFMSIE